MTGGHVIVIVFLVRLEDGRGAVMRHGTPLPMRKLQSQILRPSSEDEGNVNESESDIDSASGSGNANRRALLE